jgi:BirA family transcriptional regulator, biotin operon repressor / biotin---[acetyl-CoA-carboxylase] ligase
MVTPAYHVHWHDSVPSTMDIAAAMAAEGAAHGVVVAAHEQTAGRGRRGSSWASPPGAGLYLSFIARPRDHRSLQLITIAAGVGVREGIERSSGLRPHVKWPNDVLIGKRKLAGILAEGHGLGTSAEAVVIGVGVNIRREAYPPDLAERATSLEDELGRDIDRDLLLAEVVSALDRRLAELHHNAGGILQAWRSVSPTAEGTRVEWDGRRGVTAGIDDNGALLVKTESGVEQIIAGHLHWNL